MYKKILIPLENSNYDDVILNHIKPLAKISHAQLILIHVADGYGARMQKELNLADSEEINKDRDYLQQREKELTHHGFKVAVFLKTGEPSDEILKVCEDQHCDLIAMATHGHKFVKDLVLGSVAENIRHRTDTPILMVRSTPKL